MNPPITCVHVVEHTPSEPSGYSVRTHAMLRALQARGQRVVAIAPGRGVGDRCEDYLDGVRYIRVATGVDTRSAAGHLLGLWRLRASVAEVVRQVGAHLIHAHSPGRIGLVGIAAARASGRPCLYEVRGLWEDAAVDRGKYGATAPQYRATRGLETFVLRHADAVAALGRPLRDEIIARGVPSARVFTVENGVDVEQFSPRPAAAEWIERYRLAGAFVVGYVGYFYRYEGVDVLMQAFAQVRRRIPHAKLLLVGEGDMAAELRAMAQELEITPSVIFAGAVPHDAVAAHHALCDVVVYPRRRSRNTELMTPLKPLEAMAMGRSVVVSDVGGLVEVAGDAAAVFRADDPDDLAATLIELGESREERLVWQTKGRQWSMQRTWSERVVSYLSVYERLAAMAR